MEMRLKVAVGLFLLVQACQLASLQYSTDSPGRMIDKSYLRGLARNATGSENAAGEESNEPSALMATDSPPENSEVEENVTEQDQDANGEPDDLTTDAPLEAPMVPLVTPEEPELPDATTSQTTAAMNPSQTNITETEENSNTSVMTPPDSISQQTAQNTTGVMTDSHTDLHSSTLAPEVNTSQELPTTPAVDVRPINATGSTNATAVTTEPSSTAAAPFATAELTTAPLNTADGVNKSEDDPAAGSNSEGGVESGSSGSSKNRAWGAVLGTAVAVGCVGMVVYFLLKKQHKKDFSHRKLVEEFHTDPVLRLDNGEPLDFSLGGSAYYNPGLQGDNIQMSKLPGRR